MLRVLLVDDEPFILQGIKMLIDWEQEGFEIAGMAANGKEAIAFLEQEEVDLIIADIRMPEMTGLELLETIKREKLSNAYFVILSGYADFEYARRAMQNECTEYLLKPIDREMLLKLLEKVYTMRSQDRELDKKRKEQEKAYFSRNVIALIHGKYDDFNLEYVKQHMKNIEGVRYVEIQKAQSEEMDESIEKDMRNFQRELYQCCIEFLKEDANHCVFDVSANEKIYDIGLIFADGMAQKLGLVVGDKVRLMITENSQYTPFGRVPMQRLFTVSELYYDYGEASGYEVFANLADIGRLMRIQPGEAQGYRLFLDDPFQITELPTYFKESHISDWRVQKGEFFQAVRMEKNMMGLLISLIIVVAISNIVTSLSLMVVDKQGEIAILQTQGVTKSQVRSIFIYQGLLVGLVGTLIGAVLGVLITLNLGAILSAVNPNGVFLPTSIEPVQVIIVIAFSLLLSLLSTIYPAYRAAKTEPAEALRYE